MACGEAHTHPYVSPGRKPDGTQSIFRVPAQWAWDFNQIGFDTPNSWPALMYDVDRRHAHEWLVDLAYEGLIPWPNWTVERLASTHAHACLTLKRPVLHGEGAKHHPMTVLARVSEYLAQTMGADRGYKGVIAHNPVARTRQFKTRWGRRQPYTLAELRAFVPKGWRRPPPAQLLTTIGRNNHLFTDATRWRWREANHGLDVLDYLVGQNEALPHPLDFNEVRGIAKSVQKYWERHDGIHTGEWRAKQARRGRKSGDVRRAKEMPRDHDINIRWCAGWSEREIAQDLEVPRSTVNHVVNRDGPVQLPLEPIDDIPPPPSRVRREQRKQRIRKLSLQGLTRPQIAIKEGVSRATVDRALR